MSIMFFFNILKLTLRITIFSILVIKCASTGDIILGQVFLDPEDEAPIATPFGWTKNVPAPKSDASVVSPQTNRSNAPNVADDRAAPPTTLGLLPWEEDEMLTGVFEPGLSSEEIRRRKAEQLKLARIKRDAETRNILAKLQTQNALLDLLGDIDGSPPKVFLKNTRLSPESSTSSPSTSSDSLFEPITPSNLAFTLALGTNSNHTDGVDKKTERPAKQTSATPSLASTTPSLTSTTPSQSETPAKMSNENELISDEEKQKIKETQERREAQRKQWLARRAESEAGADFFELPLSLNLTKQQLKDGYINLFDGKSDLGWQVRSEGLYGGGRFFISDNVIESDPKYPGMFYSTNSFGDMILEFEFQSEPDAEVYLLLRTPLTPDDLKSSCYSIVLNSTKVNNTRGTILGRLDSLLGTTPIPSNEQSTHQKKINEGEWHRVIARFEGGNLQLLFDDKETTNLFEGAPIPSGHICFLVSKGRARFRNIRGVPGAALSLFDGIHIDESLWNLPKPPMTWTVSLDNTIVLTGGPGILESVGKYKNFILQFDYNSFSGESPPRLFFHATAGEPQTGYELSLQTFPSRAARDKALGVDVGGFYGLKNARYLKLDEYSWHSVTLLVNNGLFQTWVNGVPVNEMTISPSAIDPKKESGTFQFFSPNADSTLQLRNIRVTTLPN
ncbi:MAG: 3-keto-disaccharide hydrolase [Thermoguttaceae bacterium]